MANKKLREALRAIAAVWPEANRSIIAACFYFGSPAVYPCLRPMTRCLCAGVGVVVRVLINILAGRECACVCV